MHLNVIFCNGRNLAALACNVRWTFSESDYLSYSIVYQKCSADNNRTHNSQTLDFRRGGGTVLFITISADVVVVVVV